MPVIRIDFDNEKVEEEDIIALSEAAQKIVSEVTAIEDVFVYANSSQIKVNAHPIEVFVEMSAHKIPDVDDLMAKLKARILAWKTENNFILPINLTLDPKPWKIEIGI
ncbi:MAG: hypothetical protein AAB547_01875 [Patescibacteria group bacterium]